MNTLVSQPLVPYIPHDNPLGDLAPEAPVVAQAPVQPVATGAQQPRTKMEFVCEELGIRPGSIFARQNSYAPIRVLQRMVKVFHDILKFYFQHRDISILRKDVKHTRACASNHVSTVVKIENDHIFIVESYEDWGGVISRSLNHEEFQRYINNEFTTDNPKKKDFSPEKCLKVLNHNEITQHIATEAQRMADYYEPEAAVKREIRKLKLENKNREKLIKTAPKFAVVAIKKEIDATKLEIAEMQLELKKLQPTDYAWYRLTTSPHLPSMANRRSNLRTIYSYNSGGLMNSNGKKRKTSICSEKVAQLVMNAQIFHALNPGEELTLDRLKEFQKEGRVLNFDAKRVTPRNLVQTLENSQNNFVPTIITLEDYWKKIKEYETTRNSALTAQVVAPAVVVE